MKYAFIDQHRRIYEVAALCEALEVSRSGYYAARGSAELIHVALPDPW